MPEGPTGAAVRVAPPGVVVRGHELMQAHPLERSLECQPFGALSTTGLSERPCILKAFFSHLVELAFTEGYFDTL